MTKVTLELIVLKLECIEQQLTRDRVQAARMTTGRAIKTPEDEERLGTDLHAAFASGGFVHCKVKSWFAEIGYGFLLASGKTIFAHTSC
eukprot:12409727-Karenia_brevis.AAC.1